MGALVVRSAWGIRNAIRSVGLEDTELRTN
jgi:hypothetical protein